MTIDQYSILGNKVIYNILLTKNINRCHFNHNFTWEMSMSALIPDSSRETVNWHEKHNLLSNETHERLRQPDGESSMDSDLWAI